MVTMVTNYPRIVLAAPNSSSGKTTVSIGLMAALHDRGLKVAPFKVGPDYIDPGYHTVATGLPGRNLDAWLCGTSRIAPLFAHGAAGADVSVVEGVMGLYDGRLGVTSGRPTAARRASASEGAQSDIHQQQKPAPVPPAKASTDGAETAGGRRGFGSTAHVAELIDAPVVLVMDASGVSRTLAASAYGLASHPHAPKVAGVIINKAGSARAVDELRDAFDEVGLQVLGAIPRSKDLIVPSRHLGLVPAAERDQARAVIESAAKLVVDHVDLDAVLAIARSSAQLDVQPWSPDAEMTRVNGRPRVAVAAGRAFTFRYAETTELLQAAGCEVVEFDPMTDRRLPAGAHGLYIGGGFPEIYAEELAANRPLLADVRAAVGTGLPTVAECAGLLYLCHTLDGMDMADALPLDAQMSPRLTMGYRELVAESDSLVTRAGETVYSHEFHRTMTTLRGGSSRPVAAWLVDQASGRHEGLATDSVLASYQHIHWAGYPEQAQRFAEACAAFATSGARWEPVAEQEPIPEPNLRHHGDAQLRPGLVDLAVNVRPAPGWLLSEVASGADHWMAYPVAEQAQQALASKHGLAADQLLLTAGAADAFTLVARTFPERKVLIVHPQFTEPEVAFRTAGHQVRRLMLRADEGFRLDASRIGADRDLVIIGNPTNPTGVLHSADQIRKLVRPGRIVLVDEAFMDFVPGEAESMFRGELAGLLVTRSLTKLWGIAGLRAGFVVGDASLIAEMACHQEPWPVSTPALDAMIATTTAKANESAAELLVQVAREREHLVDALSAAGFPVAGDPQTPFVLVDVSALNVPNPVESLAERGFAVRRCDTFPGLGPNWIRLAVPDEQVSDKLVDVLVQLVARCG